MSYGGYPFEPVDGNGNPAVSTTSTSASFSISVGGVAQTQLAVDATRVEISGCNPHGSEGLWLAVDGVTAAPNGQGSYYVPPLGPFYINGSDAKTAISFYAATTGHAVSMSVGK